MKMRFMRQVQPEKSHMPQSTTRSTAKSTRARPPVVRLPPKSNVELALARGSQLGAMLLGFVALVFALDHGEFLLAPVALAIVIGLMFGPVATRLERRGLPKGLSALAVTALFVLIVLMFVAVLAAPLAMWIDRLPQFWAMMQDRLSELKQPLEAIKGLRDQLREAMGAEGLTVSVEEGTPVESLAVVAPAIGAQILLFLASLYFFVATRDQTRMVILRMCIGRRLRWRVAHIFRDVEWMVSRYLLSISAINVALGVTTGIALWAVGVPQPWLWGALAGFLNFVVFIGPAAMLVILFAVGLVTFDGIAGALVPPLVYSAVNLVESQFVTPMVIGRNLELNPFIVLLALAFWIWIWGPIGGFIAIPALLITYAIARNILPGVDR
jgi:predicted PurR-regulated permease PerM